MRTKNAYLTVYMSLMIPIIFTFLFTLLHGAKRSAIKMQTECVTDIALNATFSEYNRELLNQYDLLFVDMAYGGQEGNIYNVEAHFQNFLQGNLGGNNGGLLSKRDILGSYLSGAAIKEYSLATDSHGEVMKRQIVDYYSFSLEGMLNDLLPKGNMIDASFWEQDVSSEREGNEDYLNSVELPEQEVRPGEFEQVYLDNPADVANRTRGGGILGLVLDSADIVSTKGVNLEQFVSHRTRRQGYGLSEEARAVTGDCSELLFQQYIFDKLGYWEHEKEESALDYQVEYVIAGNDRDYDNLESVCKRLLLGREAANVAYIFTDAGKVAEAEAWAAGLTAVILLPELLEPVKISILFAWAYVEGLQDIKILLEGGHVPLQKTAASWHTSLSDILNVREALRHIDNPSGLTYKDYIYALLFLVGGETKTYRVMDVMEMDIRKTPGNAFFCMDNCTDSILAKVNISSWFGGEFNKERRYGYYFVH